MSNESATMAAQVVGDGGLLVLPRAPARSGTAPRSWRELRLCVDVESGETYLETTDQCGGSDISPHEWNGVMRAYTLASSMAGAVVLTASEIAEAIEPLLPLAQRVLRGASVRWDDLTRVGVLDDDATDADMELQQAADEGLFSATQWTAWAADDWLDPAGLQNWPEGLTLDDAAARIETEARRERVVLLGDVRAALLDIADEYLDSRGRLGDDKLQALVDAGRITPERAASVNAS